MTSPVFSLALRMGDNTLILAQQNAKWCGHAPTLEEDIALANIALDLIGQARFWLSLAGQLEEAGRDENQLAFLRDANEFRNNYLVEQKNGDYAQTVMRQYLFDIWHLARVKSMCTSTHVKIAEIAQKVIAEIEYHVRRSRDLVLRLGTGTEESITRMQGALDTLWPSFGSLFEDALDDPALAKADIAPLPSLQRDMTIKELANDISTTALILPQSDYWHKGSVQGIHSENLGHILSDMQFLQRAYPGLGW